MCGISGASSRTPLSLEKFLPHFQEALFHRGPDGKGVFECSSGFLFHNRLSIIDIAGGAQPLYHPKGWALVANGEIYNFLDLKKQFPDYPFKTHSDCEVILPLWERYGPESIQKLRGMFSFALFIPEEKTLYLSRDPFGIKPLYYTQKEGSFFFASEIRPLLKALGETPLHNKAIAELLNLRYTTGDTTLFSNIKRVLPGETLKVTCGEIIERHRIRPLLCEKESQKSPPSLQELDNLLEDDVRLHLQSDVPYGLFLSGGIDSSIVLSLMGRLCPPDTLKTYSIGFPNTHQYDERSLAEKMALSVGATHKNIDFTESDFWELLPEVVKALDDPVIDYAALPTFKLAKVASQDVKVALCGEGGDESFAGYRRHQKARWPRWMGGRLWRGKGLFSGIEGVSSFLHNWDEPFLKTLEEAKAHNFSPVQTSQFLDFEHWLPNDLLTKLDRCLMAWGIEGRTPFVDSTLSPYGFFLPDRDKVSWKQGKLLLRKYLEKTFPVAEPYAKKRGFNVPIGPWLKRQMPFLKDWLLSQAYLEEIISREGLLALLEEVNLGQEKSVLPLWALLFYSLWFKIHVENSHFSLSELISRPPS